MNIGWKCPVCEKGNAPAAMKCGHCADSQMVTRSVFPSPFDIIGPGLWPQRPAFDLGPQVSPEELDRAVKHLAALGQNQLEQKAQ